MLGDLVDEVLVLDGALAGADDSFDTADTAADDPAQLYYSSGTTGLAKGILHAHRYILAHNEFVYCHEVRDGERFHGMGEWAWAAGIAPLLGLLAAGATQLVYRREGGFDPHRQLDFLPPSGLERLHDAHGHAGDDGGGGRGERYPQQFRIVARPGAAQPRGDPLVPRPVRPDRPRLLRPHRVPSAVRQLPLHGGARGLDGQAGAGGTWRYSTRTSSPSSPGIAGDLPAGAFQPALAAGLLEQRGSHAGDLRRRVFHTKDAAQADEDG